MQRLSEGFTEMGKVVVDFSPMQGPAMMPNHRSISELAFYKLLKTVME